MSSAGSSEQDFATGALRDFVKDWERAGKRRFAIGELLRYLGVEPPALLRPGYDEHPGYDDTVSFSAPVIASS